MLIETVAACLVLIFLVLFSSINLHNILVIHKPGGATRSHAEIDRPSGVIVGLAALGTVVYFCEATLYSIITLINSVTSMSLFTFILPNTLILWMQIIGLILTSSGFFLSSWSVIARGKYATSWKMGDNHKLVTRGPYRYIRHPSYLAYFAMFIGLFAIWPGWLTLIPLTAIPGYVRVTAQEEKLLETRFGQQYSEYRSRTGPFAPKLKTRRDQKRNS
jgi:protein-S-isoprenylcysteine O-methyltransferase Ste14